MNNYLFIDSNRMYPAKLYAALVLVKDNAKATYSVINVSQSSDLAAVSRDIANSIKSKPNTTILINAEYKLQNGYSQEQKITEVAFWLRCKFKLKNTVVFYSLQSLNHLLKTSPENFILISPGCYHLRLPINKEQINKIVSFEPLSDIDLLKPFLKPKINLRQIRHKYANYAGMNFMSDIVVQVHSLKDISNMLDNRAHDFDEFYRFRNSLAFYILGTYFDLERGSKIDEGKKAQLKIANQLSLSKRILLIDDLADKGWKYILGKMIYGDINDPRLVSLPTHRVENGKKRFDLENIKRELVDEVSNHKPHLVLLDLRLNDEVGKKSLEELGGFRLLKHIKSHAGFKGVRVIMFTASSNAEAVKELLNAGAEAVWTKPGIDEGLSAVGIIERYAQLITLISDTFSPSYNLLSQIDDNTNSSFDINNLDFEAIRNLLFSRLDFIKYRLQLNSASELLNLTPEPYKSVDAIYVDANILLEDQLFGDTICSIYKLAILTANSQFRYKNHSKEITTPLSKVVIMNSVFDEIIKIAKKKDFQKRIRNNNFEKNELLYLRATMSQLIIKQMFTNKLVRTELDKDSPVPQYKLMNPKENIYADGYILDEVADLLITHSSKKVTYCNDTRIVFITGDNKLKNKLEKFANQQKANLIIKSRKELVADMSSVYV